MQTRNTFELPVVLIPALTLLLPDPLASLHVFMGAPLYCLLLMDHAGLWWAWVGESLSSTQCLPLLPELPVNPWNLVHFGQAFTLRHREPLTFQVHLFWDCHSPACVPCLVGLAVAVDWLLLQPALD